MHFYLFSRQFSWCHFWPSMPCIMYKTQPSRTFATLWTSVYTTNWKYLHSLWSYWSTSNGFWCLLLLTCPNPWSRATCLYHHDPSPCASAHSNRQKIEIRIISDDDPSPRIQVRRDHWSSKNQTTSDILGWPNLPVDGFVQYSCKVWTKGTSSPSYH